MQNTENTSILAEGRFIPGRELACLAVGLAGTSDFFRPRERASGGAGQYKSLAKSRSALRRRDVSRLQLIRVCNTREQF